MKKRISSLLLCIVLCLSLMPMSAFAEESFDFNDLPTAGVTNITVPEGDYDTKVPFKDAFLLFWKENIKTDGKFVLVDCFDVYVNGYHTWIITIENDVISAMEGEYSNLNTILFNINDPGTRYDWWINGTYTAEYDVWVGDIQVTSANKDNILDDSGTPTATFDPETSTLMLNGYNGSYIKADTALNIVLADGTENTVSVPVDVKEYGIYTYGDCTISGNGNLNIEVLNPYRDGVWAYYGDLTVDMTGDLTVNAGDNGLCADHDLTISGSGDITVTAGDVGFYALKNDLTVSGSGDITVTSGDDGFDAYYDLTISGSRNIIITAGYNGIAVGGNVEINDACKVSVDSSAGSYYAVYLWSSGSKLLLNGTGSPISLKAGAGKAAVWNSVDSNSPVGGTNLANYTVTGAPDTASVVYTLKSTEYNLWVSGVRVTSANKDNILGDSGTPTATYDPESKTLTLNGYDGSSIVADTALNIVLADGTENTVSVPEDVGGCGISTKGDCTLSGKGDLDIHSPGDGIWADDGDLTINMSGDLSVSSSDSSGLSSNGYITISGSGNIVIDAKRFGLWPNPYKDVILSGSGALSVTAAQNAVYLNGSGKSLLLNGTGSPISLKAGAGKAAVWNSVDSNSPVGGTNLANYTVTGAPDEQSVVYTLKCSHTPVTITGKVATCTEDGWKDYYECSLCHKYFEDNACEAEIADLGAWKAAGGNGYIAPTGHGETEIRDAKEATCTEAGFTGDTYCKICGDKIDDGTAIDVKAHTYGEWATTKDPTLTEKGMKERSCTACGDKQTEELPVLTPVTYSIISGANGEWTKGSTAGLAFTSDAPFAKFGSVKVDGSTIAAANYTAVEGSTKITLTSAYLETLSVGSHSIEVVSNDGTASASFTVKAAAQPSVPTTYTVSFDMNGHGTQVAAQTVEDGNKATKPADPKANGYTFGGWYADATCSTKFDFNSAITANTTVYAKWTKTSVAPADPTSPQTGDASNMFLWIALLFVSGGALVGTTVYGKKRKRAE